MIVPQYWAEGRLQERLPQGQLTVRRFGWSDTSQQDAQRNADQRAREAFDRLARGEKLAKREHKLPYGGAEGLPIREEVLARHGGHVISRNLYGAHCLNTPNVLFADVDDEDPAWVIERQAWWWRLAFLLLAAALYFTGVLDRPFAVLLALAGLILPALVSSYRRKRARYTTPPAPTSLPALERFIESHPDWHVRLYRTPEGFRLLAMHRTFAPLEPAVTEFFQAVGADQLYVTMCRNQHCFRARLTAKPWRAGVTDPMRPRPGVWPVRPERLAGRQAWIERYENVARGFASCRYLRSFGAVKSVDPAAAEVQKIHDEHCQALSQLPLA